MFLSKINSIYLYIIPRWADEPKSSENRITFNFSCDTAIYNLSTIK